MYVGSKQLGCCWFARRPNTFMARITDMVTIRGTALSDRTRTGPNRTAAERTAAERTALSERSPSDRLLSYGYTHTLAFPPRARWSEVRSILSSVIWRYPHTSATSSGWRSIQTTITRKAAAGRGARAELLDGQRQAFGAGL